MITGTVSFHEKRRFYRVWTNLPATIYPFFMDKDKEKRKEFYEATIVNISAAGVKLSSKELIPLSPNILIVFKLDSYDAEIICKAVKRFDEDKPDKILTLAFKTPYNPPPEIVRPNKWMEDNIVKYVFKKQLMKKSFPTKKTPKHRTYLTKEY